MQRSRSLSLLRETKSRLPSNERIDHPSRVGKLFLKNARKPKTREPSSQKKREVGLFLEAPVDYGTSLFLVFFVGYPQFLEGLET